MPLIQVAGHRLEYEWIGSRASGGPTLVFLHEGLGSVSLWRDFPAALCRRTSCSGLVYSRWGHGASDPLDGPRTVRFMHEEALVARALGSRCETLMLPACGHTPHAP